MCAHCLSCVLTSAGAVAAPRHALIFKCCAGNVFGKLHLAWLASSRNRPGMRLRFVVGDDGIVLASGAGSVVYALTRVRWGVAQPAGGHCVCDMRCRCRLTLVRLRCAVLVDRCLAPWAHNGASRTDSSTRVWSTSGREAKSRASPRTSATCSQATRTAISSRGTLTYVSPFPLPLRSLLEVVALIVHCDIC